jgi:hypothetical protein
VTVQRSARLGGLAVRVSLPRADDRSAGQPLSAG